MKKSLIFLLGLFVLIIAGTSFIGAEKGLPADQGQVKSLATPARTPALNRDFGKVPVFFIPNQGQVDGRVNFYFRGRDKTIYFAPDGVTFALSYSDRPVDKKDTRNLFKLHPGSRGDLMDKNLNRWTVKMDFEGARKDVKPEGLDKTGAVVSYFKGKPEAWRVGLPAYSKIVYRNLWPGIDLVYKGEMNRLKSEFVVHTCGDPEAIRLTWQGAERVWIDEARRLEISTPGGDFGEEAPKAYQKMGEKRVEVPMTYKLREKSGSQTQTDALSQESEKTAHSYGFEVGVYDKNEDLVLDPAILIYCGYIGGASSEMGMGIAVDRSGNAYITGQIFSDETTFPVNVGPDLTLNGEDDAFVAKINPSGTSLVYCGYIGGASFDYGTAIAVDSSGNAYVTGVTESDQSTFPVTVGPDLSYNTNIDAFVAKVNPTGTSLVYCGYIGGSTVDDAWAVAVDGSGSAYISGETSSGQSTFPVVIGPDLTANGGGDAFVAKVDRTGISLVYCGYIGGSKYESGQGIAVDLSGNAYIIGKTLSDETTFPVTVGPDLSFNGEARYADAFVAKVDPTGNSLLYCGYIGGSAVDDGWGIAVDRLGNAYLTGWTYSDESTFPVTVGPDLSFGGVTDAFVAKINPTGTSLLYCGYIGGSAGDTARAIAVDGSGNAYITGYTDSDQSTFPVTGGPDLTFNGQDDVYVAKINPDGTSLLYCGYIGGPSREGGYGIAVDGSGNAYITGYTDSNQSTFPVTRGPDLTFNGFADAFVAKIFSRPTLSPPILIAPDDGAGGQFTTLALEWQDMNSGPQETQFKVRIREAGRGYVYHESPQDSILFIVSKLSPNKTHFWNVKALGNGTTVGSSSWADGGADWSFTTSSPVSLITPTLTAPSNASTGQSFDLNLQWNDPNTSPQEVGYKVRIRLAGEAYTYINAGQNITSALKTGLAASKTYSWNVRSVGDGTGVLSSAWANEGVDWSFTTSAPVTLNPPVLIAPTNGAIDQLLSVTLQWTDTNTTFQEKGYQIRIKPAGGAYTNVTTLKNAISYLKKGLVKNKIYYWNVRAKGTGTSTKDSAWANSGIDWKFTAIK